MLYRSLMIASLAAAAAWAVPGHAQVNTQRPAAQGQRPECTTQNAAQQSQNCTDRGQPVQGGQLGEGAQPRPPGDQGANEHQPITQQKPEAAGQGGARPSTERR